MKNKSLSFNIILSLLILFLIVSLTGCGEKKKKTDKKAFSIAVFVPGVLAGSPTYEMMDNGVRAAATPNGATVKTIEGGFNQAEWAGQITALAAEQSYDLIVTSNPSMPEICRKIQEFYPEQNFLNLEGSSIKDDQVSTFFFNHKELAFLLGNFAGFFTESRMENKNSKVKVGLIAGQEYPEMNNFIKPGFEMGFKNVNDNIELDFRVIGNWYDAAKAAELASDMYSSGADIILTIAGGANQGVLTAAKDAGKFVLWYDSNGYGIEPGVVIGSGLIREDKAAEEMVLKAIKGSLKRGTSISAGVKEGYIDFIDDDSNYLKYVPQSIRDKMETLLEDMRSGKTALPVDNQD
ncbi:MAG: BMP family ABC transporter substrate-binding protein [Spirochaetaceae bacterium]|jgi:basic membrane lipoprotein Med (substrate-binding protein (PBP1-ABC) superfamily)|nr:BMP family ABC transporter substrate-binding protein [Spirochaetaceae bacterium]